jgi:hypothetical protein
VPEPCGSPKAKRLKGRRPSKRRSRLKIRRPSKNPKAV